MTISPIFDPSAWREVPGFSFTDITYHRAVDQGTVRVAFNRPEVRNAFRPHPTPKLIGNSKMVSDLPILLAIISEHELDKEK